jgi:hypothetical protein
MAVTIVGLLGIAALGVDLGYLYVARNELQNVADGSALAGARALGSIYQGLTYEQQQGYVCGTACADSVRNYAEAVANNNQAAGVVMSVRVEDVLIGQWDGDNFTETSVEPDAVQIVSRRDDVYNGPVTTFFARILGVDASSVNAVATAALTGQGTSDLGEVELPIGISRWFFDQYEGEEFCNQDIQFYPTNDPASCAGWTSWEYGSNDATLRKILEEDPAFPGPETIANETVYEFTGGTLSNPTFDELLSLFQRKGFDVDANWDYLLDGDLNRLTQAPEGWVGAVELYETDEFGNQVLDNSGNPIRLEYPDGTPRNRHKWETTVPVYDRGDCSNPNQSILIVGFAEIELRDVLNAPDKLVRGTVKCNLVDPEDSRGGGGEYGIKGSVPGLVR